MRGTIIHCISAVPQHFQLQSGKRGVFCQPGTSAVFIKAEIMTSIKSASPLLLPKDVPRENPQGCLLADISWDRVIKLLFKLQGFFCPGNVGNEC